MSDYSIRNEYMDLLKSLMELNTSLEDYKRDSENLANLTQYLQANKLEICKFKKITADLQCFLNSYEFSNGFNFSVLLKNLLALHSLRLILVEMGEEAKKLKAYPDRYGSYEAIEKCRELTIICLDRLTIGEIEKATELVHNNIKKLKELQVILKDDSNLLTQIKQTIERNKSLLSKYSAYYSELITFVAEFPHDGKNDLRIVEERIENLKYLENHHKKVEIELNKIKFFCDRYNKGKIQKRYAELESFMINQMQKSDLNHVDVQLNAISNNIEKTIKAFDFEKEELIKLKDILSQQTSEIWEEDRINLFNHVSDLLGKDTKKVSFDISALKNERKNLKERKLSDINLTLNHFKWLNFKRYKRHHSQLISMCITSDRYRDIIEQMENYRMKRIILLCIPIIGWYFLSKMKDFEI